MRIGYNGTRLAWAGKQVFLSAPQPPPPLNLIIIDTTHSLVEKHLPVGTHKVPDQALSDYVACNTGDGGCGVLSADLAGVQSILKVSVGWHDHELAPFLCAIPLFLLPRPHLFPLLTSPLIVLGQDQSNRNEFWHRCRAGPSLLLPNRLSLGILPQPPNKTKHVGMAGRPLASGGSTVPGCRQGLNAVCQPQKPQ